MYDLISKDITSGFDGRGDLDAGFQKQLEIMESARSTLLNWENWETCERIGNECESELDANAAAMEAKLREVQIIYVSGMLNLDGNNHGFVCDDGFNLMVPLMMAAELKLIENTCTGGPLCAMLGARQTQDGLRDDDTSSNGEDDEAASGNVVDDKYLAWLRSSGFVVSDDDDVEKSADHYFN